MVKVPGSVLRTMWQTKRGREHAWRLAFREGHPAALARQGVALLAAELFRQGAFGGKWADEEESVAWEAVAGGLDLYAAGKLSKTQAVQLGLAWKGTACGLGWGGVAPTLPAAVRGPAAFVLGHRFLKLGKPKEAADFFRTAVTDAPADSALRRLAQAELDRLKGM